MKVVLVATMTTWNCTHETPSCIQLAQQHRYTMLK